MLLCILALGGGEALADVVYKTKSTTSQGANGPASSVIMTIKVKGEWQRTEMEIPGLASVPGIPLEGKGMATVSLLNKRTGETYFLRNGKFMTTSEMFGGSNISVPGGAIPQTRSPLQAAGALPDFSLKWEDTGKSEKVGNYNCRIYIRRNYLKNEVISEAKVWITSDLKHLQPLLKQLTIEMKGSPKAPESNGPDGIEIREEIETNFARMMMASQPPGARVPQGMKDMRMKTVMEFISLEEVELPEREFETGKTKSK